MSDHAATLEHPKSHAVETTPAPVIHSGGALRALERVRWHVEPDDGTLELSLPLLAELIQPSAERGSRTVPPWELERPTPSRALFLRRGGSSYLRLHWFNPGFSVRGRTGLRVWRPEALRHLEWTKRGPELGLPVPEVVGAGVITPTPWVGQARSFVVTRWAVEMQTASALLRAGKLSDDARLRGARALLVATRALHWNRVGGLRISTSSCYMDPRNGEIMIGGLSRLRRFGLRGGGALVARDVRDVEAVCRRLIAGTKLTMAAVESGATRR